MVFVSNKLNLHNSLAMADVLLLVNLSPLFSLPPFSSLFFPFFSLSISSLPSPLLSLSSLLYLPFSVSHSLPSLLPFTLVFLPLSPPPSFHLDFSLALHSPSFHSPYISSFLSLRLPFPLASLLPSASPLRFPFTLLSMPLFSLPPFILTTLLPFPPSSFHPFTLFSLLSSFPHLSSLHLVSFLHLSLASSPPLLFPQFLTSQSYAL